MPAQLPDSHAGENSGYPNEYGRAEENQREEPETANHESNDRRHGEQGPTDNLQHERELQLAQDRIVD